MQYMKKELPTKDKVLISNLNFEFVEFSKIENRYIELFNELINKSREENLEISSI